MTAPLSREELAELQSDWDFEARAYEARRPAYVPTLLDLWIELWRTAPRTVKLDLLRLALCTPAMIMVFAGIWIMVP